MKKRLLSLLLCLVAGLTLLPLPALADGGHSHCICGGGVTAGDHTGHTDVTYQPWNGTSGITYANGAAYVYLTGNATLSGHLTVDGKTLYLCLNGKTLASNGTAKIQVKNGGRLVLCDCRGGGTFKGATQSVWGGACIYLYTSTLDMFGGKLTGGKVHVTDRTNASRTMLYNIRTLDWDDTLLKALDIPFEAHILSAHRTPAEAAAFAKSAKANGFGVILCAAGMAAHLAGAFAANTTLPVIGIPMKGGAMDGLDALLATVQMPSGIPVATVALNGAKNAAWLAAEILALSDDALAEKLAAERTAMAAQIAAKEEKLQAEIAQL